MEDFKLCQSCGMPLMEEELRGTNSDNSLNEDYCIYCFKDGSFTQDVTMDQMIHNCLEYLEEYNKDAEEKLSREEALMYSRQLFPTLKRWREGE